MIVFPSVGRLLDLSPQDFGLFAALAIHDTGSVLGAAMSFNNEALETATTVKLFRTLWLVPLILFISFIQSNKKAKQHISKIAKVYVELAEKCFENNATNLFIPSDCNDVKFLERKQNELFALGIRLNQGAKVWK